MKRIWIMLAGIATCGSMGPAGGGPIRDHLARIRIPVVRFERVSVEEAVDFARMRCIECDPGEDPTRKGVSMLILKPRREPEPADGELGLGATPERERVRIDYHARDVPLTTLLVEIARQARLDLHITSVGIVFCPKGRMPFPNFKAKEGEVYETLHRAP
jgi:hypothetical protein